MCINVFKNSWTDSLGRSNDAVLCFVLVIDVPSRC